MLPEESMLLGRPCQSALGPFLFVSVVEVKFLPLEPLKIGNTPDNIGILPRDGGGDSLDGPIICRLERYASMAVL